MFSKKDKSWFSRTRFKLRDKKLYYLKEILHNDFCFQALVGLARSDTVRQIMGKLPIFNNGQLQCKYFEVYYQSTRNRKGSCVDLTAQNRLTIFTLRTRVKVFWIIPELRILRLSFHRNNCENRIF